MGIDFVQLNEKFFKLDESQKALVADYTCQLLRVMPQGNSSLDFGTALISPNMTSAHEQLILGMIMGLTSEG